MSVFSDGLKAKIDGFLTRYETKRSAILPVLHAIQDDHGWIKPEHLDELEARYGLSKVHVKEVISFYDIYRDVPTRKFVVRYCDSITCRQFGSTAAMARISSHIERLDKDLGADGPFELQAFACLGKCDGAPVMLINKDRHEHATADKVDEMLAKYAPLKPL